MSGKLTLQDIRAEAKAAADQLRTLRREGGEEAGFAVNAYLGILDHFIKEIPPPATNAPAPSRLSKAKPAPEPE